MLQPLRWRCAECAIHHERNVREEQHHTYMWRARSPVATGGILGLSPPKQSSNPPQIETRNTINQLRFCSFLECQAPPAQTQSPPIENFLATALVARTSNNRAIMAHDLYCFLLP